MVRARSVSYEQAVAYRLWVNNLTARLPAGCYGEAARFGLQDSGPRDALVGLHARVEACEPTAWEDQRLIQTYSPRAAVYVVPAADFGIFTVGRLPLDPDARRDVEGAAERVCRALDGQEVRGGSRDVRFVCASGRIAVRWTTSALYVREVPRPDVDLDQARIELCRRHVHAFGPTTPSAFAWWAGLSARDAAWTWRLLADELAPVDLCGQEAWILAADAEALGSAPPPRGVRLLPAPDLRLFGRDRTRLFVGPGLQRPPPLGDSFHAHGLLVDGQVVGAWARRGGHVRVRGPLHPRTRAAVEAEVRSLPIPDATMRVDITEC